MPIIIVKGETCIEIDDIYFSEWSSIDLLKHQLNDILMYLGIFIMWYRWILDMRMYLQGVIWNYDGVE